MKGSLDPDLKNDLKQLIIDECDKDHLEVSDITDDMVLFGDPTLDLDSIDALQLSMELKNTYGITLVDSKDFRRHLKTINHLADYIQPE